MNIKLDENLPARLTRFLGNLGHNVDTVPQEGLTGLDDATVWHAAQQSGRFLITQDLDFSDIRRYTPGSHHGLMLLRLRDPSRRALAHRIQTVFGMDEAQGWAGALSW
ncbi:MAG: DUF5615 family PIN-like protein [Nitrospira sp.]